MLYTRSIEPVLKDAANSFPAVFLTGPRQSGKTTLLKTLFPEHRYISLETPSILEQLQEDPINFLQSPTTQWVIDEAQNFPKLFSYLQGIIDAQPQPGRFILSGSQNFLIHEKISQTLAGRTAILQLMPLSYQELVTQHPHPDLNNLLFYGGYPRPRHENIRYDLWFNSYIQTYLERDIRSLVHIKDLLLFQRFLKVCAHRHGQLLNLSALAIDCSISQTTARDWLSHLETSYITFRIAPYFKNYTKRLVKTPKLYFYDSGLICHLLGIESLEHLQSHASRGAIFEGFLISEMIKAQLNKGKSPTIYFWRDHKGLEIDAVNESGGQTRFYEIKSSQTFHREYLHSLMKVSKLAEDHQIQKNLIMANEGTSTLHDITVMGWKEFLRGL